MVNKEKKYAHLSVLLIDDDYSTREILAFFLEEIGFSNIHCLASGTDGLEFIKSNPDWRGIVVCDWNMPVMSGADLYRAIKKTHEDIPFIMVTGRSDEESVLFAKDSGIYAYILKPVSLEELARKIEKVSINHASFLPALSGDKDIPTYTL